MIFQPKLIVKFLLWVLSFQDRMEEARRHCEKLRELGLLAEKLGCSTSQLSIAWSLKHEPVKKGH